MCNRCTPEIRRTQTDRERYEWHAAPEAIYARILREQRKLTDLQREVRWLERLHLRRCREVQRGEWPYEADDDE